MHGKHHDDLDPSRYAARAFAGVDLPELEAAAVTPEWVQQLIQLLETQQLVPKTFWGRIEINCQGGGISNVNINQSFKKEGAAK